MPHWPYHRIPHQPHHEAFAVAIHVGAVPPRSNQEQHVFQQADIAPPAVFWIRVRFVLKNLNLKNNPYHAEHAKSKAASLMCGRNSQTDQRVSYKLQVKCARLGIMTCKLYNSKR